MKIGSLFSGIGGLDLACEEVFSGQTIWQVERDPYCQKVLAARWPDAERFDDVTTVGSRDLQSVDVLCGGFPCQDLSVAGKRAGLDGERSGLYREMLRLVSELRPRFVVFENVPELIKYRSRVDGDLQELGYGARWQICEASDVGAPHRRRRVFVLAVHGAQDCTVLPRPSAQPDLFAPPWERVSSGELWPTALADGDRKTMFAQGGEPLGHAVRWPTPLAADGKMTGRGRSRAFRDSPGLPYTVIVATPAERSPTLDACINPCWVDLLMGFPAGWTDLEAIPGCHAWPLGRGPAQAPHEPPRLVPKKSVANRSARLRALGNAVVPQQAVAALRRMVAL
jgi:DNA (cytosine-5)-methyltransferase 1